MAQQLSNQHAAAFDRRALVTFQAGDRDSLSSRFYTKRLMNAASQQFSVFGEVIAVEKAKFQQQAYQEVENEKPVARPKTYVVRLYLDEDDVVSTTIDDMLTYGTVMGKALIRRKEQLPLNALDTANADAYGNELADLTADTAAVGMADWLTPDLIAYAAQSLADKSISVMPEDCSFIYRSDDRATLTTSEKAASSDYITGQVTRTGMVPPLHGFRMIEIENRTEGGVKQKGGKNVAYAVHRNALGIADVRLGGREMATDIEWNQGKIGWDLVGRFRSACIRVDNNGIQRMVQD